MNTRTEPDPSTPSGNPAPVSLPTIALLGAGNMGGAILAGLLRRPASGEAAIRVTALEPEVARALSSDRVQARATEDDPEANRAAVAGAGIVVLAIKPQQLPALLDEISGVIDPGAVVISVAAGVPLGAIESRLPAGIRAVRAMPNTPAMIGLGVTGIAGGSAADAEAFGYARAVFESVGTVIEVPESQIDAVTAVSGSGPAHIYLLIEQMTEAAERLGFDTVTARDLVVGTFRGAAEMVAASPDVAVAELRRRVTSPKGTTEKSVESLQRTDFAEVFELAFRSNLQRSAELSAESS